MFYYPIVLCKGKSAGPYQNPLNVVDLSMPLSYTEGKVLEEPL